MTGMSPLHPPRAVLFALDDNLAASLKTELARCGCETDEAPGPDGGPRRTDIVFCPPSRELLRRALELFPRVPVVVVSRLPEVEGWLDALEEGAADYCAAPFESIQLRWLIETHTGGRRAIAAA